MKLRKIYEETINKISNNQYEYIGDCLSTVDELKMWDATEMAQFIENSKSINVLKFLPFINDAFTTLKNKIKKNPNKFEAGKLKNIVYVYDTVKDIHYFWKKI